MDVLNVEIYSIITLLILLLNYSIAFKGQFTSASKIWMALIISVLFLSFSNICFEITTVYEIRVIAIVVYLLSIITSSLCIYSYVNLVYINPKANAKREVVYMTISVITCVAFAVAYLFVFDTGYEMHSFDRNVLNKLFILAVIPNITACILYIINNSFDRIKSEYLVIITLLINAVGISLDMIFENLYFISASYTLAALLLYINKQQKMLNTDPLTGLSNVKALESFLTNFNKKESLAIYCINVDKFKIINKEFGYLKGDTVLKKVANIVRNAARQEDLVMRTLADEFMIISKTSNVRDAEKVIDKINEKITTNNEKSEIKIDVTIGWGIYRVKENDSETSFPDFLEKIKQTIKNEKRIKAQNMTD